MKVIRFPYSNEYFSIQMQFNYVLVTFDVSFHEIPFFICFVISKKGLSIHRL